MSDLCMIGMDVGGTSTRALIATLDGSCLGVGRAAGGNPTSHGGARAGEQIAIALRGALAAVDPTRVRAGVIGLAGAGRLLADPASRAAVDAAWRDAGLACPYEVVGDALVAFAAGTAAAAGTVLIAGTGAIAASVRGHRLDRIADGHGWLLGDAGSGFWIGREAVRHALATLDAARSPDVLTRAVIRFLLDTAAVADRPRDTVDALVQRATAGPPVELAALAPLVISGYAEREPAAVGILDRAASHLVHTVGVVRAPGADSPIVLAGGLLTVGTPLATAVSAELAARWPAASRSVAKDGAAAAAWLAACTLSDVDAAAAADLHRALLP
ncbi:MAG TPA: BadF/BadG/BcrA/BcrD ATPase family protein [Micromonosporaceae bacterium]|jgi:N-acetylglucosamine kinase-like BadF-type ATPase